MSRGLVTPGPSSLNDSPQSSNGDEPILYSVAMCSRWVSSTPLRPLLKKPGQAVRGTWTRLDCHSQWDGFAPVKKVLVSPYWGLTPVLHL